MLKSILLFNVVAIASCAIPTGSNTNLKIKNEQSKKTVNNVSNYYDFGSKSYLTTNTVNIKLLSYSRRSRQEYNANFGIYDVTIYQYSRFADLKIRDIYNRKVLSNSSINFTTTFKNSVSETYTETYKEIYEQFNEIKSSTQFKKEGGFNLGGELFKVNCKYTKETQVNVTLGESFTKSIENSITSTKTYETIIEEEISYTNNNSFDVIHSLCYRGKYNVYKIVLSEYKPIQIENNRGIHGVDYSYKRQLLNTTDYYFFTPTYDPIYVDQSIYTYDKHGELYNVNSKLENNIVYL